MFLCETVDHAALDQVWSVKSRSPCLLLKDHRAAADFRSGHKVADPELQQISATELAAYCEVEQRAVGEPLFALEEEMDLRIDGATASAGIGALG